MNVNGSATMCVYKIHLQLCFHIFRTDFTAANCTAAQPHSQIVLETAAIAYSLFSTGRSHLRRQLVWRASRLRAGTITPPGGLLLSPCLSKDTDAKLLFLASAHKG